MGAARQRLSRPRRPRVTSPGRGRHRSDAVSGPRPRPARQPRLRRPTGAAHGGARVSCTTACAVPTWRRASRTSARPAPRCISPATTAALGFPGFVTQLLAQHERAEPSGRLRTGADAEGAGEAGARWAVPCHLSLETPMACGVGVCFSCVTKVRTGGRLGLPPRLRRRAGVRRGVPGGVMNRPLLSGCAPGR